MSGYVRNSRACQHRLRTDDAAAQLPGRRRRRFVPRRAGGTGGTPIRYDFGRVAHFLHRRRGGSGTVAQFQGKGGLWSVYERRDGQVGTLWFVSPDRRMLGLPRRLEACGAGDTPFYAGSISRPSRCPGGTCWPTICWRMATIRTRRRSG